MFHEGKSGFVLTYLFFFLHLLRFWFFGLWVFARINTTIQDPIVFVVDPLCIYILLYFSKRKKDGIFDLLSLNKGTKIYLKEEKKKLRYEI